MWKRGSSLIPKQMAHHGLSRALSAGIVCQEAERLYPDLFKATALVNGTLRISTTLDRQMAFRLIEGKLLQEVMSFSHARNLPPVTKIRLTIIPGDAIV